MYGYGWPVSLLLEITYRRIMRIGILTYHRAHNYGAMLQAYALRTFLQEHGHIVDFIDYWPVEHAKEYALLRQIKGSDVLDYCKNVIANALTFWRRWHRIYQFNTFAKEYLQLPTKASYSTRAASICEKYDCVVVGSDQIWRNYSSIGKYYGFDPTYFCQTLVHPTHCITYAASMGVVQMDTDDWKRFCGYLNAFSTILVREQSLANLVRQAGHNASVVIDPTLLLDKTFWNRVLPSSRFCKERYVLYYELMNSPEALAYAKQKAKELHCKLLIMDARIPYIQSPRHISFASPIQFMQAIRDAEFVIPTSFHGTAFSLIFEKQFIATGLQKNADRVQTLLSLLKIPNYYQITPGNLPNINYSKINKQLQFLRNDSIEKLQRAIES